MAEKHEVLLSERVGAVVVLTINRPEALNALNADVLVALRSAVADVGADPTVRAVVLTGAGEKAFSAGADIKEMAGLTADQAQRTVEFGQQVLRAIERLRVPVIAAVNGLALGGGFELVLSTTFPILSTRAMLGLPESGLGLIPGYGGTQRLPRVVGRPTASFLMLTGARLDADRAFALGLTPTPPVPPEELLSHATTIANTIAAQGPTAVRSILRLLEYGRDAPLESALALETVLAALAVGGAESDEGIAAFLARRAPRFQDAETGAA